MQAAGVSKNIEYLRGSYVDGYRVNMQTLQSNAKQTLEILKDSEK